MNLNEIRSFIRKFARSNGNMSDTLYWTDPDNDICSRSLVIKEIEIVNDDHIRIIEDDAELECPPDELKIIPKNHPLKMAH